MAEHVETSGIRFGRTVLAVVVGELVDQPVQGIVYPANTRGVMGAGPAGAMRSAAGAEVEREAMGRAPSSLGSAYSTSSGLLAARGIEVIFHAVVVPSIGQHSVAQAVLRGLDETLKLAGERKIRSIALPLMGVSADDPQADRRTMAEGVVDVVIKRLRQRGVRLERIVFVVRFTDDRDMLAAIIQRARERVWTTSA